MVSKQSNGDVILVRNLYFSTKEGAYYKDPHGFYSGRPSVIVGQDDEFYNICVLTTNAQKSVGFRNRFFLGPNMIIPAKDFSPEKHKSGFVDLSRIHSVTSYHDYPLLYKLSKITYIKLLDSILAQYNFHDSFDCCYTPFFPALISINSQSEELKRELKF